MDSMQNYKDKLDKLDSMLSKLKTTHARVRQLKRNVYVLKTILSDMSKIKSPYGPETPIARFSLQ